MTNYVSSSFNNKPEFIFSDKNLNLKNPRFVEQTDSFIPKIIEIVKKNVIADDFASLDLDLRRIRPSPKGFTTESIHQLIQLIKESEPLKKKSSIIYHHLILNLGIHSKNISEFPTLNEEFRFACAKIDLENNAGNFCKNIEKYGFENQERRIELAKAAAKIDGNALCKYIGNFGIENQDALIDIVKIPLTEHGAAIAKYIKNFHIRSQEALIDIAKSVAATEGEAIAKHIQNFEIQDQEALCEIAKIAAEDDGEAVSIHIHNFPIDNEKARFEIAWIAMDQNALKMSEFLNNYNLTNVNFRMTLFLRAINYYPESIQYIDNFFPDKSHVLQNYPELRLFGLNDKFNIPKFLFDLWEIEEIPCSLIAKPHAEYAKCIKEQDPGIKTSKMRWLQLRCCVLDFAKGSPLLLNGLIALLNTLEKESKPRVKDQKMYWLASLIMHSRLQGIHADTFFKHLSHLSALLDLRDPALRSSLSQSFINLLLNPALSKTINRNAKTGTQIVSMLIAPIALKVTPYIKLKFKIDKKNQVLFQPEITSFHQRMEELLDQKYFKDTERLKSLLHSLCSLVDTTELTKAEKRTILRDLIFVKEDNLIGEKQSAQLLTSVQTVAQLIECGACHSLTVMTNPHELPSQIQDLVSKTLQLNVTDFNKKFFATFGSWRKSGSLLTYANKLQSLGPKDKPKALSALKEYVESVLNNHFYSTRYDISPSASEHMQKLFKEAPKLLDGWKKGTQFTYGNYEVIDTDHPCDLLLSGTEVGSCQKIDGDCEHTKCLTAYLLDGKIRMMAIKNKNGCIIARCMISLLWDQNAKKFALFQEQIYPAGCAPIFSEMLDKACIERAQQLKVRLLSTKKEEQENPITLQAFKGKMPFEYVDGLDDPIQSDAGYEISNCSYVFS